MTVRVCRLTLHLHLRIISQSLHAVLLKSKKSDTAINKALMWPAHNVHKDNTLEICQCPQQHSDRAIPCGFSPNRKCSSSWQPYAACFGAVHTRPLKLATPYSESRKTIFLQS